MFAFKTPDIKIVDDKYVYWYIIYYTHTHYIIFFNVEKICLEFFCLKNSLMLSSRENGQQLQQKSNLDPWGIKRFCIVMN